MRDYIQAGDFVHVDIHAARLTLCHRAEVLNVPCATGDSWIFRDTTTEQIHYVSEGCTISKLEKETE